MSLFNFFYKSKFSKMSSQEKAREQGYAFLLCIEYIAESNKKEKGEDKISVEDLKILTISSQSINIGSEYINCELRKSNFFDDSKDGKHFKEVLSSFDLKTKTLTIKQMLLVLSNREKLENLLDDEGNYILNGKYMTPIERISYLMGINEGLEDIVKEMIFEINNEKINDFELGNSLNNLSILFSLKQRFAILEILLFIGGINELSTEQNQFIVDIASAFQIHPDRNVSLSEVERRNLLKDLTLEQSDYVVYLIHELIKLDKISSVNDNHEILNILSRYSIKPFIIKTFSFYNNDFQRTSDFKINESANASEIYQRALEKDANNDYEGAIIDLTKAIEIDKEFIDAYRNRASIKCSIGNYEGAINDYTKIIEINPEDVDALEDRGRAKYSLKDYVGAIEDFDEIISIDNETKIYSLRGKMKRYLLYYDEAMLDYDIAVNKFPNDFYCVFGRGELKYEMANYHSAIEDFNKCIELKPKLILSFQKLGECRLKIEDYKGAIEVFTYIIKNRQEAYKIDGPPSENASKTLATYYYNRGVARSNIKDYKNAISDIKSAVELNPEFEEAKYLLKSLENNY